MRTTKAANPVPRQTSSPEWLLFLAAFIGYAYFCQGGGWPQNVRFAQVRAIVEEGRLTIDSYLLYSHPPSDPPSNHLVRCPVVNGTCRLTDNRTYTLAWPGSGDRLVPVDASAPSDHPLVAVADIAVSGDLAYAQGHFHPNKAPGTALLAVPAYALLFHLEHALGLDPDDWWILTVNAWLSTVFSIGLVSALGCVLFFRLALSLCQRCRDALLATVAFAAGTLYLPYATMLHEHDVVAVALLASFYFLYQSKHVAGSASRTQGRIFLAGLCAAFAATSNYLALGIALFLGLYLASFTRQARHWIASSLGVLLPLALLGAYHAACFGTPFTTNYNYQNPLFRTDQAALLGVLEMPHLDRLLELLVSPFRGLFFSSPVLLLGLFGGFLMWRTGRHRAEVWLCGAVVAFFLLFNCSFNGWTGGYGVGPRYLVPATAFLALPLALAAGRYLRTTLLLTILSVLLMLIATAVDPQCPLGVSGRGMVKGRPLWQYSPLTEYEIPLFVLGRPEPILRDQEEVLWLRTRQEAEASGRNPRDLSPLRERLKQARERGDTRLFPLAAMRGPVSVNPQGVYEGNPFLLFPPHSLQAHWNSFNAGEFLFPGSRLSLLPLLLLCGALGWLVKKMPHRREAESAEHRREKRG